MSHVVLLGDSIFDNAVYVPGGPSVLEHLTKALPGGWRATLLAQDGAMTDDIGRQLKMLPEDATHLAVSMGDNDVLSYSPAIRTSPCESILAALQEIDSYRREFEIAYRRMLDKVLAARLPTVLATIYDAIPDLTTAERVGLSIFNDVILRQAFRTGVPVIDLRSICHEAADYSSLSPIEPSGLGGGKIARAIATVVTQHEFRTSQSSVYG